MDLQGFTHGGEQGLSVWYPQQSPRGDDLEGFADVYGFGGISTGHAHEVTEDEERELRKQRRRAMQRKKPVGFAPWPADSRPSDTR